MACPASYACSSPYDEVEERARVLGAISNAADFAWAMAPVSTLERQEVAWAAMLDTYARLRRVREIARGTFDRVEVPIPFLIRAASDAACRYVLLAHNHPTGWAWPSEADADLTYAVEDATTAAGLVLLDHVVLGKGEFYSFREGRLWQIKS